MSNDGRRWYYRVTLTVEGPNGQNREEVVRECERFQGVRPWDFAGRVLPDGRSVNEVGWETHYED